MLRVDSLDTINRRLEGQGQITFLRNIDWRPSLREFCPKLDARQLVNGVPQLCRIIFDGANDARKNYGKVNLGRFCRKVFPAHNFLRFQDHVKTRSSGSVTPIQRCRRTIRMSPAHGVTASAEASPTSVPATATEVSFSAGYLNIQS